MSAEVPKSVFTGEVDCHLACPIPPEIRLVEVPRPRHAWGDVLACPNEGCGRAFLSEKIEEVEPT